MHGMVSKAEIEDVLRQIPDPELGISLWDLGLVYGITVKKNNVKITITLTTMGCPLFGVIADSVKKKVGSIAGVGKVEVELTFDPPWGPEKISKEAKEELGI